MGYSYVCPVAAFYIVTAMLKIDVPKIDAKYNVMFKQHRQSYFI